MKKIVPKKYTLASLVLAVLINSCSTSAVQKKLKGCDSLVVTFNKPSSDSIISQVNTTETNAIHKMARFLDGKTFADYSQCGFDGNMLFFKGGKQVMTVVFRYTDKSCRHFLFDLDNKVMSTSMNSEAADFLSGLASQQNWY